MGVRSVQELTVFQKRYQLAMRVFELSKRFPPEERYALTSQVRRSSRSVCLNLRGAWAERCCPVPFVNNPADRDCEIGASGTSVDVARDCGYISAEVQDELASLCGEIGKMLRSMIYSPGPSSPDRSGYLESPQSPPAARQLRSQIRDLHLADLPRVARESSRPTTALPDPGPPSGPDSDTEPEACPPPERLY